MKRPIGLGPRHLVIPDTQCRPGDTFEHLEWAGTYAADKRPDVIIQLGDWYDMPSLSSYDEGSRRMQGREFHLDIAAGDAGLAAFHRGLRRSGKAYKPRLVALLGNHDEGRIERYVSANPKLAGTIGLEDLGFAKYGWEVWRFLTIADIHGILYSHYFCIGANGRVSQSKNGMPSAEVQVKRMMRSATAGHRQGLDVKVLHTPTATYRGLIAGSFYRHEEEYLTPQGVNHWRGILVKNDIDVKTGFYNLCEVDMRYLEKRYG